MVLASKSVGPVPPREAEDLPSSAPARRPRRVWARVLSGAVSLGVVWGGVVWANATRGLTVPSPSGAFTAVPWASGSLIGFGVAAVCTVVIALVLAVGGWVRDPFVRAVRRVLPAAFVVVVGLGLVGGLFSPVVGQHVAPGLDASQVASTDEAFSEWAHDRYGVVLPDGAVKIAMGTEGVSVVSESGASDVVLAYNAGEGIILVEAPGRESELPVVDR